MKALRILLVDDDEDDRQFFADALESLDMNTELHQQENGQECLKFLDEHKDDYPDLIFLDLNMPLMNGFECLVKIKENQKNKDAIVAIYSTSSAEKDIEETFNKGANIYINKPSNFTDLKNALKQVIKTNWTYHTNDFNKENFLFKI